MTEPIAREARAARRQLDDLAARVRVVSWDFHKYLDTLRATLERISELAEPPATEPCPICEGAGGVQGGDCPGCPNTGKAAHADRGQS